MTPSRSKQHRNSRPTRILWRSCSTQDDPSGRFAVWRSSDNSSDRRFQWCKNSRSIVWDVGGEDETRPLRRHYDHGTNGLIHAVDSNSQESRVDRGRKTVKFSQVQFLIMWWMQRVPMGQKVQKTVEPPRMWYMNTIVDMLVEMQTQKTVDAHRIPFPERVEGGERRSGCTDQECLRHGVVVLSRSRCASQQGERNPGDDLARQHSSGNERWRIQGKDCQWHWSGCVRAEMVVSTSRTKILRQRWEWAIGHKRWQSTCAVHSSRKTNSRWLQSNVIRIDKNWIIIGEIRSSTASLVTDRRCQRKGAEEDIGVWGQHRPAHSVGGRGQRHRCWRRRARSDQHLPPRSGHWVPWKQRECQEQSYRFKHQRGLEEQRKCNAAMRVESLEWLAREKRRMVTSTQTEEVAICPSELHVSRREEDVQAVCLRHHESDARLLGAGWTCTSMRVTPSGWCVLQPWWLFWTERVRKTASWSSFYAKRACR